MSDSQMSVTLKNDLTEIERLSHIVDDFCQKNGVSSEMLYPLNLVLDEIITNVISYGYEDEGEHEIIVRLAVEQDTFIGEVEDDGIAFNPLDNKEVDTSTPLEEKGIGGLGVHFAKTLMDGLSYKRENDRNILTMRKNIV